mgnify:FL=1
MVSYGSGNTKLWMGYAEALLAFGRFFIDSVKFDKSPPYLVITRINMLLYKYRST